MALILHIHDWLTAHKAVAVFVLLIGIVLSALSALRLNFQENITDNKLDAMHAFADAWNAAHEDIANTSFVLKSPL